jgi:hypothetical protein
MFKQVVAIDNPLISHQTTVPQQCVTVASARPKLLQMLLAALVSTKSQTFAAAKLCQTLARAGHETARISFRPPNTIFQLS